MRVLRGFSVLVLVLLAHHADSLTLTTTSESSISAQAACQPNTYYYMGNCAACPKHSTTQGLDACISSDQCICDGGYSRTLDPLSCEACPQDTYSQSEKCVACPDGSNTRNTTAVGSVDGCICPPGFRRGPTDKRFCIVCGRNSYGNDGSCTVCPEHSTTSNRITATDITMCLCDPGYVWTGSQCILCPENQYVANGTCVACPAHSSANKTIPRPSIDSCVCDKGFEVDNRTMTCAPCRRDTYGVDGKCVQCPLNSTTFGKTQVEAITGCRCQSGYSLVADAGCALCSPDMYGFEGVCIPCGSFESTNGKLGAVSKIDCVCMNGYIRDGRGACVPCPINTFQQGNVCVSCATNSSTNGTVGNAMCVCQAGYGLFTKKDNSTQCLECPVNTYSNSLAQCVVCPNNSHTYDRPGARDVSGCVCASGYHNVSIGQCTGCPINTFGKLGKCNTCPEHSATSHNASGDVSECVCNGGYKRVHHKCVPCEANTFSAKEECVMCRAHSHTVAAFGNANSSACVCDLGYHLTAQDTCEECPENTYGAQAGVCAVCPGSSHTNRKTGVRTIAGCVCDPGFHRNVAGLCEPCGVDFFSHHGLCEACPLNSYTNNLTAVTSRAGCICLNGNPLGETNECQPCSMNTTLVGDDCVACPANSETIPDQRLRGCVCLPGFGIDAFGNCNQCPSDKFGQDGTCQPCPTHMTTRGVSGASSPAMCVCPVGTSYPPFGSVRCVSEEIGPLETVASIRLDLNYADFTQNTIAVNHVIQILAQLTSVPEDNIIISGIKNDSVVIELRILPLQNTLASGQQIVKALRHAVQSGTFLSLFTAVTEFKPTTATFDSIPNLQIDRVSLQSYFSSYTSPVDSFDRGSVTQLCLGWLQSNRVDLAIILQNKNDFSLPTCSEFCGLLKATGTTPLVPEYNFDKWPHPSHAAKYRIPEIPLSLTPDDETQRNSATVCYALCRTSGLKQFLGALGNVHAHDGDICMGMFNWQ